MLNKKIIASSFQFIISSMHLCLNYENCVHKLSLENSTKYYIACSCHLNMNVKHLFLPDIVTAYEKWVLNVKRIRKN